MNELKPEDVMRALECCAKGSCIEDKCPLFRWEDEDDTTECMTKLVKAALALLREKDKEIEVLGAELSRYTENVVKMVETARAEAITEFAERVKKAHDVLDVNGYSMIGVDIVEKIAEKMKGEKE